MTEATRAGACLCGAVRFEVDLPTTFCGHCHCTMCQRNHGAAFVTWFGVERGRLRIVAGADRLVRYRSSSHGTRSFCGTCGSSLFCESTERPEGIDVVLANMLEPIDRAPQVHVHFDSHVPWIELSDDLPRLGGVDGMQPLGGGGGGRS